MFQRTQLLLRCVAACATVVIASACHGDPTSVDAEQPFIGTPTFSGVIAEVQSQGLRLFVQKEIGVGGCDPEASAYVAINSNSGARHTDLRWDSGAAAGIGDMAVGLEVDVWGGRAGQRPCPGGDVIATGIRLISSVAPLP